MAERESVAGIPVPLRPPVEGVAGVSAAWRERRVDGGLCERLKLVGSTTVHLHGLPGKQQADVPMEVDLPRLGTLEPGGDRQDEEGGTEHEATFLNWEKKDDMSAGSPQMNEVAQGASVAEGLLVVLIDCVAADRN